MTTTVSDETKDTQVQETVKEASDNESNDDGRDVEEREDDEESPIYKNKLPNRVIVTTNGRGQRGRRSPRLQFYVDRARRILRSDENVTVSGLGQAISMACTLVEVLKRQKIAVVEQVRTSVEVEPSFQGNRLTWGRPTACIRFVLSRGLHATYVSDYHQRKVIEIFENKDVDKSGKLEKKIIEELNMGDVFCANEDQKNRAKEVLNKISDNSLNLPQFIQYASILIHPLLKDRKFKEKLKEYGISAQDATDVVPETHDDEDDHEDDHEEEEDIN
jgi:hypothetical protein